jgi:hypothetical protein
VFFDRIAGVVYPAILNDGLPVQLAKDVGAVIDAFGAVCAFELMGGFAYVNAHGACADALGAVDAHVVWIVEVNQQRVHVGKHVLQVAVGAD